MPKCLGTLLRGDCASDPFAMVRFSNRARKYACSRFSIMKECSNVCLNHRIRNLFLRHSHWLQRQSTREISLRKKEYQHRWIISNQDRRRQRIWLGTSMNRSFWGSRFTAVIKWHLRWFLAEQLIAFYSEYLSFLSSLTLRRIARFLRRRRRWPCLGENSSYSDYEQMLSFSNSNEVDQITRRSYCYCCWCYCVHRFKRKLCSTCSRLRCCRYPWSSAGLC